MDTFDSDADRSFGIIHNTDIVFAFILEKINFYYMFQYNSLSI